MESLYRILQNNLKAQIIAGIFKVGDLVPSENELQQSHSSILLIIFYFRQVVSTLKG
jgi:DNA-binding transcriptional regulator YhcF (GntR family)